MKTRLCALALLAGCSDLFAPTSPPLPAGAQRVEASDSARVWWSQVEACSGKRRDFDELKWYAVERVYVEGNAVATYLPHYAIVLGTVARGSAMVERHEMLHAIKRDVGHRHDEDFTVRCRELVL